MRAICGFLHLAGASAELRQLDSLAEALVFGDDTLQTAFESVHGGPVALGAARWSRQMPAAHSQLARHTATGCIAVVDARLEQPGALAAALGLRETEPPSAAHLVLHAWLHWGEQCVDHLRGDFAFAIWDPRLQQLFCGRDIMGVRPLYIHHAPGRLFAFASRAHALLSLPGVPNDINQGRIADFLVNQLESIDKTSTFFSAITRLPPAHTLAVTRQACRQRRYWQLQPGLISPVPRTDAQWGQALTDVLEQAVANHLDSDVEVGCMVSGGLDSSTLAVIARDQRLAAGKGPLPTFSSVDSDPDCPETRAIHQVLAQPGFDPSLIDPNAIDAMRIDLDRAAWQSDEPFDAGMLLLHAQYHAAARRGVGAVMDGIDADTLLSGGDALVRQIRHLHWLSAWRNAQGMQRIYAQPTWLALARAARGAAVPQPIRRRLQRARRQLHTRDNIRHTLIAPDFAETIDLDRRLETLASWHALDTPRTAVAQATQSLDHPNTTAGFERYHRVASWHGVEPRHPFNDRQVMELCVNLPDAQRIANGWSKAVLRRAMQARLPPPVCWRTGKQSLGWPLIQRLHLQDADAAQQRLADYRQLLAPYVDLGKLDRATQHAWQAAPGEAPLRVVEALHLGQWLQQRQSSC